MAPTVGIFRNQGGVIIGHPLITGRLNIISHLISHPITSLLRGLQQAVADRVEDHVIDPDVKDQGREREKS